MSMFSERARVRAAQRRMIVAREAFALPASSLLARAERHPLPILGVAAGAGFLLSRTRVHPLRIPGLSGLLGGVVAEVAALGASFVAPSDLEA